MANKIIVIIIKPLAKELGYARFVSHKITIFMKGRLPLKENCKLELNRNQVHPGDILDGLFIIDSAQKKTLNSLSITTSGMENVQYHLKDSKGKNMLLKAKYPLLVSTAATTLSRKLDHGSTIIPFKIPIPPSCPSSLSITNPSYQLQVSYVVEGRVWLDQNNSIDIKLPFQVLSSSHSHSQSHPQTKTLNINAQYCCCINGGLISATISLAQTEFDLTHEKAIELEFAINTSATSSSVNVYAWLERHVTCLESTKKEQIHKSNGYCHCSGHCKFKKLVCLPLNFEDITPSVSAQNINISYIVVVEVCAWGNNSDSVNIPVTFFRSPISSSPNPKFLGYKCATSLAPLLLQDVTEFYRTGNKNSLIKSNSLK